MAKHLCPNTTIQTNYSAPVPFIGLYIATATLVCFVLMLCDVIHGIRRKKTWIPCRFFALNSVTLTLLSIASKLPVDLTTAMPSAYDQLSKLTGTALICVSIGFLLPSLGSNEASECKTNMIAMTIFVITVVVNICIQMSTGIIFSFIPELVIIMFCMLVMLIHLWGLTLVTNMQKEILMERKKDLITNGEGSMLQRLVLCYLHGYNFEPQFLLCKGMYNIIAGGPCLLSLVVVLQATFKSLIGDEAEFCNGLSDYGWSMRIIIFTQILVMLLANIATVFRWIVQILHGRGDDLILTRDTDIVPVILDNAPVLKADTRDYFHACFKQAKSIGTLIVVLFLVLPSFLLWIIYVLAIEITKWCCSFMYKNTKSESIQEYIDLLKENDMVLNEGTLRKCLKDMKMWMSGSETNNSSSHLGELLSKRPPSLHSLDELYRQYDFKEGKEVSCLYLVFLVRLVSVSIPSALNGHLVGCLREVFDIIYFVDSTMNSVKTNNRQKCKLAKAMWRGKDLKIVISEGSRSDVDHALEIIKATENVLTSPVWDEVGIVVNLINGRVYTSIEELYDYMEQLFIDMLLIFLIQLPHAIVKELVESHVEAYEETAGHMLKLLSQIKHLENKVQWSFPVGSNMSRLITTEASDTNEHITSPMVDSYSSHVDDSDVTEDEDQNVGSAPLHEIIQVE